MDSFTRTAGSKLELPLVAPHRAPAPEGDRAFVTVALAPPAR
jgi:hypothetical protein